MAMSPAGLADAMYTGMEAEYWPTQPLSAEAEAETRRYYTVMAEAIVDYIKANADINTPAGPGTIS